jgi:murein DD-endopeptidase MepM/ murein hydrolase activator NlpD
MVQFIALLAVVVATLAIVAAWARFGLDEDVALGSVRLGSEGPTGIAAAEVPAGHLRLVVPGLVSQGRYLEAEVSNAAILQGGATLVTVPDGVSATVHVFGRSYRLEPSADGSRLEGFVGIGVLDPPGETTLTVEAVDRLGTNTLIERPITIVATDWTVDYIVLPPGVGAGLTPEVVRAEEDLLATTYAGLTPRLWQTPFVVPLDEPRITGYFGEQRSFGGGPPAGHHGGTDFGAFEGTSVYATNRGTVVIARLLAVRGSMVIIDHGGGVFSGYAHLSRVDVIEGQVVETGQVVGGVGTTGLSTGNHLHWELAVAGILVDGLRWVDGSQGY